MEKDWSMKVVYIFMIGILSVTFFSSCKKEQMTDTSSDNDIVDTLGTNNKKKISKKVDGTINLKAFPGKHRIKLTWDVPEYMISGYKVYWNDDHDSLRVSMVKGSKKMSVWIKNLEEGEYTFYIQAFDTDGHQSKLTTISSNAYNQIDAKNLINRELKSVKMPFSNGGNLVMSWEEDTSAFAIGNDVKYKDFSGKIKQVFVPKYINELRLLDYKRGKLLAYRTIYLPFLNAIDTFYSSYKRISISGIPDFSYAGYEKNVKAIPLVPVKETVSPGVGDDGNRIQSAIDAIEQLPMVNGFRGAVLLKAGDYSVEQPIVISKSGVVLRGEGQGDNGTVITATGKSQYNFVHIEGSGSDIEANKTKITSDIKVGDIKIPVEHASFFNVGDTVSIHKTPNNHWVDTLKMGQYGWTVQGYNIAHQRIITKIVKDTLYVNIPMVDYFRRRFGGGYVTKLSSPGRIYHCGIERLRLKSFYRNPQDEQHGWVAIELNRVENCWVRNVTARFFGYGCVGIYHSNFNTVQDCAMLNPKSETTGGRKYSFYIDKGIGNLFQRCYAYGGRHDFVTGSRVTGPNVFLDGYAGNTKNDIGPHHRWATGTLYDNIKGGEINVQNRGAMGTGHGWSGVQTMFWNCFGSSFIVQSPQIGENWAVGCRGGSITSSGPYGSRSGYIESWGSNVSPRSMFLDQLKKRLGEDAVERVTIPAQRNGDIWNALKNWAGDGNPLKGL